MRKLATDSTLKLIFFFSTSILKYFSVSSMLSSTFNYKIAEMLRMDCNKTMNRLTNKYNTLNQRLENKMLLES